MRRLAAVGRDELAGAALDRRGGVRVAGRDPAEGGKQRAHRRGVLLTALLEPGPPGVLDQRVLARRVGQPVRGLVHGHHAGQPVPPVFQAALGVLGEVRAVVSPREMPGRGDGLGADQQHHLAAAGRDHGRELVDQVLRRLAAAHLEHGPGRVGAEPAGHRAGVVIRAAQRGARARHGVLELPHPGDGVDGRRHRGRVGPRVGQRGPGRVGGQVHRRAALIAGLAESFRHLPGPGEHGGTGIGVSGPARLAHEAAPAVRFPAVRFPVVRGIRTPLLPPVNRRGPPRARRHCTVRQ